MDGTYAWIMKKLLAVWVLLKMIFMIEKILHQMFVLYIQKQSIVVKVLQEIYYIVVKDMKSKGITPIYLITDHTSFYEQYGWKFLCMVQGEGEEEMTRMYIHR